MMLDEAAGQNNSTTPYSREIVQAPVVQPGLPRAVDVVLSLIGLSVGAPVLIFSTLAIALTSPGPVLFRQERMGVRGRKFVMFKLRTMRLSEGGLQVTAGDDVRVTWVGKLLRKSKLDEVPALWNVLKGDMALVGPRPEVPRYVDLKDEAWQRVLAAKPGITDPITLQFRNEETLLAQVNGDREKFYLKTLQHYKLKGYLAYLQQRSGWRDVGVLLKTALVVVAPVKESPTLKAILRDLKRDPDEE